MRKLTARELIAWARMKFPEYAPPCEVPQPEPEPPQPEDPPLVLADRYEPGAAMARRREREQGASGHATLAQQSWRREYYAGRCWMCGKPAVCMDHVKPLYRGGSNWPANLRPACQQCNFRKNARWPYAGGGFSIFPKRRPLP